MSLPGALATSAHNNKFDGLKEYDMYLQKYKLRQQGSLFQGMSKDVCQLLLHGKSIIMVITFISENSIYFIVIVY